MSRCPPAALPFAGLGFDLSDLMTRARSMRLTPLAPAPGTGHRPMLVEPPHRHGYALLLSLSREIQGP